MYYDRDRLELVDKNDKRAARVLKRYKSERLYGVDYETPKYHLPIFILGCFGYTFLVIGAVLLVTSIASTATGLAMVITSAVIATPHTIYWWLTSANEPSIEKFIEEGRIRYNN